MTGPETAADPVRPIWALGRYIVIAELGRGGMAEVYLAVARGPSGFSKLVVLKLLRAQYAEEEQFLEMFLAEARLAARLNHPNVVQTYEVAQEGGRQCIVMEYLEGRTLAETWQGGAPMPLPLAIRVVCDTLSGLHHAHELTDLEGNPCGLVHRDVSPQNIIITYDGQVKVLDFGIAKVNDSAGLTRTGTFKGKVRYAATERIVGNGDIDRRADVFSAGVLLWEAATRQRLWSGMGDLAIMHRLAQGEVFPAPSTVDPTVPQAVDAICARALAPAAADRYATAAEMQDALEDYLASWSSVPITARAVAKFMTDTFAEPRERFQRLVDDQLRLVAHSPLEELPTSMSRIRSASPHGPATDPPSSVSWPVAGTIPSPLMPTSTAPPARRSWLAAGAALALGGSLALAWMLGRGSEPPRAPAASPVAEAMPLPAAAPSAATSSDAAPAAPSIAPDGSAPATASAAPAPRRTWTPPPRSSPRPASAAASPAPELRREVDCSSPYYVDERGLKKIRSECL